MAVGDQDFSELYCYVAGALSSIAQGAPQNADWYLQQAICKFPRVEVADQGLYCLLQLLEFEVQQEFGNYVAPNIILDVLADAERHEYFADLYVRGYSVACQSAAYSEGFDSAELVIGTAMQAASRLKISRLTYRMRSLRAAYLTAYGESDAALTELQLCGGSIAASAFWFERFCRSAAEARVLIAEDQLDDARHALATIEAGIDREMHVRSAVTLDCIRVQYLHNLGDFDQMCELLKSILLKAQYKGLRAPIYEEVLGLLDPLRIMTAQHGSDAWFEKPRHWIEEFVDKLSTRELQVFAEANPANVLTAQERRVMLLIKQGLQNKIVAHELNLAEATVKYHLRNIYKKLGVNNRRSSGRPR
jgi:LuxR family maltose regulon positive regulatory protein